VSRSLRLYLEDILSSSAKILRYTEGMTFEDFIRDERTYDAVLRNLQIIGEVVKNVPIEFRDKYEQIQWRKMAGLRDILAHAYFSLEDEIIWDVVENKVPILIEQMREILLELK